MLTLTLAATLLASPSAGEPASTLAADAFALRATHVHVGDGTVLDNGFVVISDGKIQAVGTGDAPDGVRVDTVEGHIAPGFIALRDATGAGSEANETARKMTPDADLGYAFDPHHPAWKHVVAQGITTVVMTPNSSRVAGGLAAIVSPASGTVVKRGAALSLGMSSRSLSFSEAPTSYAGLYASLEAAFAAAPKGSALARSKAGSLPVMIEATSRSEVLHATAFAKAHGLKGALVGPSRADEVIASIKESGLGVVLTPAAPGKSRETVEDALALQKAGIPFAFTADSSTAGPAAMRMTVASCMRGGLGADAALAALTSQAATLAGVGDSHGKIATGMAADLVVWSGSPLDLTSRVHAVYAGGTLAHHAHSEGAGH